MTSITWTRPMLNRLHAKIEQELEDGKSRQDTFVFDGHVLVLGYAQYLAEYLDGKLPRE